MRSLQLERSAGCGRGHEGLCDDEQSYDSTRNVVPTCASDIGRSRAIAHESVSCYSAWSDLAAYSPSSRVTSLLDWLLLKFSLATRRHPPVVDDDDRERRTATEGVML